MFNFAKRILLSLPFVRPASRAAQCASEAGPVAFSQVGLPHTMLILMVMFAGALEGPAGVVGAAFLSALAELLVIAPKLPAGTFQHQMAYVFAGIHVFIASAVSAGLA